MAKSANTVVKEYSRTDKKKGASRRKHAGGMSASSVDTEQVPRAADDEKNVRRMTSKILRGKSSRPSGRGISGDTIFVSGKRVTSSGATGRRPKPPTRSSTRKRTRKVS